MPGNYLFYTITVSGIPLGVGAKCQLQNNQISHKYIFLSANVGMKMLDIDFSSYFKNNQYITNIIENKWYKNIR